VQGFVTQTRHTLDRALAALPVTQHDRLWQLYLEFVTQEHIPMDTAFRVYRRYLKCALREPLASLMLTTAKRTLTSCAHVDDRNSWSVPAATHL
jgi:hypothetical protein